MEKMNVLTLIITLVVGVILTGALLGPVISDTTKTTETFTNEGLYRMSYLTDDSPDVSLSWDSTAPWALTIGTEVVNFPSTSPISLSAVSSSGWGLRMTGNTFDFFSDSSTYTAGTHMDVTISAGTITLDNGSGTTKTATYTDYYLADPDGAFVMKDPTKVAHLNGDSVVFATGRTSNINCNLDGTIDDGITITVINPATATVSNEVVNAPANNKYVDIYDFSSVTFDVTPSGGTAVSITYSQVIVPYQVTSELTEHLTPGQISLMGAIPVMVIVALLMAAVGAIALRRAD